MGIRPRIEGALKVPPVAGLLTGGKSCHFGLSDNDSPLIDEEFDVIRGLSVLTIRSQERATSHGALDSLEREVVFDSDTNAGQRLGGVSYPICATRNSNGLPFSVRCDGV